MENMKKCPQCLGEVEAMAKKCKHCGSGIKSTKMDKAGKILMTILVIMIVAMVYSVSNQKESINSTTAATMARPFVEKVLVSPGSAQWTPDAVVIDNGNNKWTVVGSVDSQNKLGSLLRSKYSVTVQYSGGEIYNGSSWKLEKLSLDGKEIYPAK